MVRPSFTRERSPGAAAHLNWMIITALRRERSFPSVATPGECWPIHVSTHILNSLAILTGITVFMRVVERVSHTHRQTTERHPKVVHVARSINNIWTIGCTRNNLIFSPHVRIYCKIK
mmetsp:Transcript_16464/g.29938  ORF Transcript_16464/g.29938 Transcript_16464/m.29938 type:complete len:118 (-) Transcript_16464:29-382(-)